MGCFCCVRAVCWSMPKKEPEAAEKYHDTNERDIQSKQHETVPEAIEHDPEIDADAVNVLPGTGGPDDVGDVELDPAEYNRDGHPDN